VHGEETVVNGRSSSGGLSEREEARWRCCPEAGAPCGALAGEDATRRENNGIVLVYDISGV